MRPSFKVDFARFRTCGSREQCTGPTEMKRKHATPGLKHYPNSHYLGEEKLEKRNIRLG